jgi:hypothetical protein
MGHRLIRLLVFIATIFSSVATSLHVGVLSTDSGKNVEESRAGFVPLEVLATEEKTIVTSFDFFAHVILQLRVFLHAFLRLHWVYSTACMRVYWLETRL